MIKFEMPLEKLPIDYENFPNLKKDEEHALTYFNLGYELNNDLFVITCGHEKCDVNKPRQGPRSVAYFIMHFVVDGKGTFIYNDKAYNISKNTAFVIFPNDVATYQQDLDDPWEYYWVSFTGLNAKNYVERCTFSSENPVLQIESKEVRETFRKLSNLKNITASTDLKALSLLLDIFAGIIEEKRISKPDDNEHLKSYVAKALSYIKINFHKETLSLKEVANALNINANYLSRLFASVLNMPFSKYLILLRLQEASKLLKNTDMYIKNIASTVGYSDNLYFSRIFKKYMGMTPKEFRNYIDNKED